MRIEKVGGNRKRATIRSLRHKDSKIFIIALLRHLKVFYRLKV